MKNNFFSQEQDYRKEARARMQVRDWSIRFSLWVGILLLVPLVGLSKAVVPSLGMHHKFYVKRIKIEGRIISQTCWVRSAKNKKSSA